MALVIGMVTAMNKTMTMIIYADEHGYGCDNDGDGYGDGDNLG